MIEGIGIVGDRPHDLIVQEVEESERYYRDLLTPSFQQMVENWKLYTGDREDMRLPHEKDWRANVHVPWPYSGMETQVATTSDIMMSLESPIQPDPVGTEDEKGATKIGRLLDYFLRRMRYPSKLDVALRESGIQGTACRKAVWMEHRIPFQHFPTDTERLNFDQAIREATQLGAGEPPSDADELMLWIDIVNQAGKFGRIPPAPVPGPKSFVQYQGPGWEYIPLFDMRFDPMVAEWQEQPIIIQRICKPQEWVLNRTGPAPDKPFDPEQVRLGLEVTSEEERFSRWEREIAEMLDIRTTSISEPRYKRKAELWEVWRRGERYPYMMILNRKAIINKTPGEYPYWHKQHPFHPLRSVLMPGKAMGLAEMTQLMPLAIEMDTLRNLRIDAVTLSILPVLLRLKEVGMPDALRRLVPGMILDMSRIDGVRSLNDAIKVPQEVFREIGEIKQEWDETQGTQDVVRGSAVPFSRTTATEVTQRLNRAIGRQKQRVIRIEDEMSAVVPQWLMLCYQFAPDDWKLRVGGEDPARNPFQQYGREDFFEGLHMDYRFRGATNAINRELKTQQLSELFARAMSAQRPLLAPTEARRLLQRVMESTGQRGFETVFTAEGESFVQLQTQLEHAAMLQSLNPSQPPGAEGGETP